MKKVFSSSKRFMVLNVSRIGIHETLQLVSCCSIHKLVDYWEWKAIFRACLVKVGEVYTYAPLAIVILHQNRIGYPLWKDHLLDETIKYWLLYLFFLGLMFLDLESSTSTSVG